MTYKEAIRKLKNKLHYIKKIQEREDKEKQAELENKDFSLIASNCTGGYVYHWLGLQFKSPFINLWIKNEDFIMMLENLDDFLATPLKEDVNTEEPYPVGIGYCGVKIFFTHYASFEEANKKWEERKQRIDPHNLCVWMSNWSGNEDILKRFDALPFVNKVIFVNKHYEQYSSAVYIPGFEKQNGIGQIFETKNFAGKRYIDKFDYVKFFNNMQMTSFNSVD